MKKWHSNRNRRYFTRVKAHLMKQHLLDETSRWWNISKVSCRATSQVHIPLWNQMSALQLFYIGQSSFDKASPWWNISKGGCMAIQLTFFTHSFILNSQLTFFTHSERIRQNISPCVKWPFSWLSSYVWNGHSADFQLNGHFTDSERTRPNISKVSYAVILHVHFTLWTHISDIWYSISQCNMANHYIAAYGVASVSRLLKIIGLFC